MMQILGYQLRLVTPSSLLLKAIVRLNVTDYNHKTCLDV